MFVIVLLTKYEAKMKMNEIVSMPTSFTNRLRLSIVNRGAIAARVANIAANTSGIPITTA